MPESSSSERPRFRPLIVFLSALFGLLVLRLVLGSVAVPLALILPLSILVTIVFVAVPLYAIYLAAAFEWNWRWAGGLIVTGVLCQGSMIQVLRHGLHGPAAALADAVALVALPCWCLGLGALVALLPRDKNLVLPIAIILAIVDAFLVWTPAGFTQKVIASHPDVLPSVAYSIPQVQTQVAVTKGPIGAFAYVGPADFLFLSMFFILLFRFRMRTKETMLAMIPSVLLYMGLSLFWGSLPMMVVVGPVVLLVNLREFKLTRDEAISTAVLALIFIGVLIWGLVQPGRQAEPSRKAPPKQP